MALPTLKHMARRVASYLASFAAPVFDIISRREEKTLTAEIEKCLVERAILYITYSYPKAYPASKPFPERVVIKGQGWRAVYLEKGMKLADSVPPEIATLLRRLEQEHIVNLQNLLRFLCEHSHKVRTEVAGFDASSRILGYVQPDEMSGERSSLQTAIDEGFDPDFKWEVVKILPA